MKKVLLSFGVAAALGISGPIAACTGMTQEQMTEFVNESMGDKKPSISTSDTTLTSGKGKGKTTTTVEQDDPQPKDEIATLFEEDSSGSLVDDFTSEQEASDQPAPLATEEPVAEETATAEPVAEEIAVEGTVTEVGAIEDEPVEEEVVDTSMPPAPLVVVVEEEVELPPPPPPPLFVQAPPTQFKLFSDPGSVRIPDIAPPIDLETQVVIS